VPSSTLPGSLHAVYSQEAEPVLTLRVQDKIAKSKLSMSGDIAKALARVSGGLYVVTAERGGAKGAMIASWVAQASFEPLGLTIAVAKDRAIESLMQVGGCDARPHIEMQQPMASRFPRSGPTDSVVSCCVSCGAALAVDLRTCPSNRIWV